MGLLICRNETKSSKVSTAISISTFMVTAAPKKNVKNNNEMGLSTNCTTAEVVGVGKTALFNGNDI